MVRPVSLRIAGGLPAFPWSNGANRHAVPGLWTAYPFRDSRRRDFKSGPCGLNRLRGRSIFQLDAGYKLRLIDDDILPVGRTPSQLGAV